MEQVIFIKKDPAMEDIIDDLEDDLTPEDVFHINEQASLNGLGEVMTHPLPADSEAAKRLQEDPDYVMKEYNG